MSVPHHLENTAMSRPRLSRPTHRTVSALVLAVVCSAGLAGCSTDGGGEGTDPTTSAATQSEDTTPAGQAVTSGLAKHVAGDLDGASADYETALTSDPQNVLALYNLGLIAQTRENLGGAEARYREVLAIDPMYQPAVFNLAIVRKALGDAEDAEALYRRAIELRPGDAGAHLNLGLLLRETDRQDEGNAEVATALELNPEFVDPAAP